MGVFRVLGRRVLFNGSHIEEEVEINTEESGGVVGDFEFSWDTPNIGVGVDTGIVIPKGTFLPYGNDWVSLTEDVTADDPEGNFDVVIGSGPDLGIPSDPGPDTLASVGSTIPFVAGNEFTPVQGNEALQSLSLNPFICGGWLVNPDVDLHVWLAFWGQLDELTGGAGVYHIRA